MRSITKVAAFHLIFYQRHSESQILFFFFDYLRLGEGWPKREVYLAKGCLKWKGLARLQAAGAASVIPFPCSQECKRLERVCTKLQDLEAMGCCTCPYLTAAFANENICCGSRSCRYMIVLIQHEAPQRIQSANFLFLFWVLLYPAISPSHLHLASWKCDIMQVEMINFQN